MALRNLAVTIRLAPWLTLATILALFLVYIAWLRPKDYFGLFHDDAIYFSSAQSLAQGRGYRLPSIPGPEGLPPLQTKYPVLYPWFLSWTWKWGPSFPANISGAVWTTTLFGCWFLIASFLCLRRLEGLGYWPALACVGLCAFHPFFLFLSGAVMSDVPFAALAITAALMAACSLSRKDGTLLAIACGVLAGLSVLTRTMGVAVVAGIVAAAIYRRCYRRAAAFCLAAAPIVAVGLWWSQSKGRLALAALEPGASAGWRQTWLYYTSYSGSWKASISSWETFQAMLTYNLKDFLQTPAALCLFPALGGEGSYLGTLLCITLTAGILSGLIRQARGGQWGPIHFIFPVYSLIALLWNYALMDRFLIVFLPLFYAGLWIEARHVIGLLRQGFRQEKPVIERALAVSLGAGLVALGGLAVRQYLHGIRPQLRLQGVKRAALLPEKMQVYEWIRQNAAPTTRFVAYEDVSLYLHTGRQAMWPLAFSTGSFYLNDDKMLAYQLAHLTDVPRHIGAQYWVAAEGDYYLEAKSPLVEKRFAELKSVLPVVFRSSSNKAQVYDLSCLHESQRTECRHAAPILFPGRQGPE